MDMLEFLRTRRTYRRFEQRPVAPEILTEAVDAARIASCGANRQTVRYIVVQSADAVAAVQPPTCRPSRASRNLTSCPPRSLRFCRTITCPARPMWTSAWHWAA